MLSATANPVRYALYLVTLFKQGNSSLKDNGTVSPSLQLSTIHKPFEVVVVDPSNLMVYFFLGGFATITSLGISSLSEHSSSLGN